MTLETIVVLVSVMTLGGLLPSASSLAVLSRSATSGFFHGLYTSLGIVLGDSIFIIIAIYGLSTIAKTYGALFELVVFVGAAYLIWLGTMHWQNEINNLEAKKLDKVSLLSSFLAGLFITLADQKAILFYFVFFPAILNLSTITVIDTFTVIIITTVTLGSAKLFYAFIGLKGNLFINNTIAIKSINKLAGATLISIGSYIMLTT